MTMRSIGSTYRFAWRAARWSWRLRTTAGRSTRCKRRSRASERRSRSVPSGGLGIYLVRKTMDGVAYRREGERNVVTLTKQTAADEEA